MATTTTSPNMSLVIPVVGEDPGPQYASDINASLNIVDAHDHSVGNGVQITPSGLSIISDLAFNNNNGITFRSVRFQSQLSPLALGSDVGCLYESGVDLYYNDGAGNQVRITQSGGVAGSPGSIAGLASPASATYVSADQTFVWQSDASTAANMDMGSIIIRRLVASSFGITISAPASLSSNYSLILPSLPGSQKFMTLDGSGNIAAPWAVDNSTIEIASSTTVRVKDAGITNAKLAANSVGTSNIIDQNVTQAKLQARSTGTTVGAGGVAISATSGVFSDTSTAYVLVTSLSVTLTTTGRPVMLLLKPDEAGASSYLGVDRGSGTVAQARFEFLAGGVELAQYDLFTIDSTSGSGEIAIPVSSLQFLYPVAAGTITFTVRGKVVTGSTFYCVNAKLVAYEI